MSQALADAGRRWRLDSAHGLDEVGLQSARRWFFAPATLDGRAVPFVATLVIEFKFH